MDGGVFERDYGISPRRFHYIPFKINGIELIQKATVGTGDYIFTGGRSRPMPISFMR